MQKAYAPFRRITIPVYGSVDITGLIGIINNPSFQRLRNVRQLGLSEHVFPGALHTRFEHSIGAMAQCREFIYPMVRKDMFGMDLARTLEIAALLHDVGHAPLSHVLENLLHCYSSRYKNHNVKEHPSAQIISNKSIGAEKIAYVRADRFPADRYSSSYRPMTLIKDMITCSSHQNSAAEAVSVAAVLCPLSKTLTVSRTFRGCGSRAGC